MTGRGGPGLHSTRYHGGVRVEMNCSFCLLPLIGACCCCCCRICRSSSYEVEYLLLCIYTVFAELLVSFGEVRIIGFSWLIVNVIKCEDLRCEDCVCRWYVVHFCRRLENGWSSNSYSLLFVGRKYCTPEVALSHDVTSKWEDGARIVGQYKQRYPVFPPFIWNQKIAMLWCEMEKISRCSCDAIWRQWWHSSLGFPLKSFAIAELRFLEATLANGDPQAWRCLSQLRYCFSMSVGNTSNTHVLVFVMADSLLRLPPRCCIVCTGWWFRSLENSFTVPDVAKIYRDRWCASTRTFRLFLPWPTKQCIWERFGRRWQAQFHPLTCIRLVPTHDPSGGNPISLLIKRIWHQADNEQKQQLLPQNLEPPTPYILSTSP